MGGRGSLTLVRIGGIPVRLHYTFLIILPYLAWVISRGTPTLASQAEVNPATLLLPPLALGLLLALGLFLCVLIHEFAHIVVGKLGGARFSGVTLMIVGGVSEVVEMPRKPSLEAAMAIAGPLSSMLLAIAAYLGYLASGQADLRFGLFYLAYVNFALAIFNLIPAFPMDGGRVLRALLAMVTSRVKATRLASWIGQGIAVLFLVGGALSWNWLLLLVGLLVVGGARAELEMVKAAAALDGLTVQQAMQRFVPAVASNDSLISVLARMQREVRTTYFVLDRGDFVGLLTFDKVREAATDSFATAADAMRRNVPALSESQSLNEAARIIRESGLPALPVLGPDGKLLLGMVSPETIGVTLRAREETAKERKASALREREAT